MTSEIPNHTPGATLLLTSETGKPASLIEPDMMTLAPK